MEEQTEKEIKELQEEVEDIKTNLLDKLESKIITPLNINMIKPLTGPRMLIFGGTGVIGMSIIKKFYEQYKIYIYSRNTEKHQNLKTKYPNIEFIVGDIRDKDNVNRTISFVFPTVIIMNFSLIANIDEMIKTNINGVSNVVNSIVDNPIYLHSSIDKSIIYLNMTRDETINIAEKLVINTMKTELNNLKFMSIRYGNIIESKNSIINKCHHIGKTLFKSSFVLNSNDSTLFLNKFNVNMI